MEDSMRTVFGRRASPSPRRAKFSRRRLRAGHIWENEETLAGWREHARHRMAQRLGRERWYEYYKLEVAHVVRQNAFERRAQGGGVDSVAPAVT
jgi:hypothetical protein